MKEDLTGKKFGRLTAIDSMTRKGGRKRYWLCECDCGKQTAVSCRGKGRWILLDGAMGGF